jgi:microcystin-dependent protein
MAQPYVGEIRMFAGNFPINGWLFCDGSLLPISENEVLFQLIGTTYGGDGQTTFALPNLQSRVPVHMGTGPSGTT